MAIWLCRQVCRGICAARNLQYGFLKSTGTCWALVAYDERKADRNEAKRRGEGFYLGLIYVTL